MGQLRTGFFILILFLCQAIAVKTALADGLSVPMPVVEAPDAGMRGFQRDSVLYMISSFAPELTENVSESQNELLIPQNYVTADVMVAIQNSREVDGRFNYNRFRMHLGQRYLQSRAVQHDDYTMPESLNDFLAATNFQSWDRQVVTKSRVKGMTRVVYTSPPTVGVEMRIAQTLETMEGDLSAPVRETEVIFRRKRDKRNWDFFAYDKTGVLSTQSTFRNGPMPSPAVCMACHYSSNERAFVPIME